MNFILISAVKKIISFSKYYFQRYTQELIFKDKFKEYESNYQNNLFMLHKLMPEDSL